MTISQPARHQPPQPSTALGIQSTGYLAMILFILSEATLFGVLLSAYFYLESGTKHWPPNGISKPDLVLPIIATIILALSSGPVWWADRGIAHGRAWQLRLGFAITFGMGLVFLAIQAYEYTDLGFSASTNAYGSLFILITGIHFLHVVVGLLMNLFIQLRAWLGHFTAERRLAVQNAALYWHFVDVVWIVIFLSLIVSPHLMSK
ncbi:MAG TPA: cytochrome c oxidase subunit 3 [Thermomicrobiaceae bacterium]|nr:cytochrome c oxidase subunit 3 [Thermomicrobiaceae bacterium]